MNDSGEGGSSVSQVRPLARWPRHDADELAAAVAVLTSGKVNYWTGRECRSFEDEFAAYHGVKHGVALANGTLALELAFRVLGLAPGDEVVVTPRSYFASVSSIVLAGGKPIFADVDEDSQNITAETIAPAINSKTRAILAVHLAGWPCDMPGIMRLAEEHGLRVVEDCAQAHGAAINGKRVGSFGAMAAFSFCQDKIMTTAGEGGMLITSDDELWSKAWSFKDHGKSYELSHTPQARPGFRWLHETVGSNYRMTEFQATIGRIQLRKLDGWVRRRRENAARLIKALEDIPAIRMPRPPEYLRHAYYKLYAFIRPERLKPDWSRDRILNALEKSGVPALSGSCPEIYREPAFAGQGYSTLPAAERLGETSLMFLVHPTLSNDDIDHIGAITRQVLVLAAE